MTGEDLIDTEVVIIASLYGHNFQTGEVVLIVDYDEDCEDYLAENDQEQSFWIREEEFKTLEG